MTVRPATAPLLYLQQRMHTLAGLAALAASAVMFVAADPSACLVANSVGTFSACADAGCYWCAPTGVARGAQPMCVPSRYASFIPAGLYACADAALASQSGSLNQNHFFRRSAAVTAVGPARTRECWESGVICPGQCLEPGGACELPGDPDPPAPPPASGPCIDQWIGYGGQYYVVCGDNCCLGHCGGFNGWYCASY